MMNMKELNFVETANVSGGISNLGTVCVSTGAGAAVGTLAGILTYTGGYYVLPIAGGVLGSMGGFSLGMFIVLGAAAIRFANSETSIYTES